MLDKKVLRLGGRVLAVSILFLALWAGAGARTEGRPTQAILPEGARAELVNSWLAWRLEIVRFADGRQERLLLIK